MTAAKVMKLAVAICGVVWCASFAECERRGFPSETLHMYRGDDKSDKQPTVIQLQEQRVKRDAAVPAGPAAPAAAAAGAAPAEPALPPSNITVKINHLNDSHQQLMVHWVGEGSSVIICLARDPAQRPSMSTTASALYMSYDYGDTFVNMTESFTLGDSPSDGYAQLDKFYNHPIINSYCVFTDIKNKMLYQTGDNGKTIRRSKLDFSPSEVAYSEEDTDTFVILDKIDPLRKLYLTRDGGVTFKVIEEYVKSFYWISGPDHPRQFYVERAKPSGNNVVLSAPNPHNYTFKSIIDDVQDFQIKSDFMFATKKSGQNNLDLYISYQRGPFIKAEFQTELDLKEFHVSDVTGTRIFISVSHTDTLSNLYVSEINKDFTEYNFVLSLESILCYFPNSTWKSSWLNDVAEESFADFYKVEGLRGIYIASKVYVKPTGANIGPEHLVSHISFDHGNTWGPIKPPTHDDNGNPISCALKDDCSLHVSQKFSQLYPVTRSATILSSKSAPGIIMATGVVGTSLKGHPGVFISRDAGLTWKQVLKDYYFFNHGDHGGILVAVKYFKIRGETKEILYSTDEGERWSSYQFHVNNLRVYGLMTEPGENTTVFTMFGSAVGQHQWIIIKVDLFKAFSYNCTADDYKFWSPSSTKVGSKVPCILGVTDYYQRRIPHANCYNGQNYDRPVRKEVCECDRQDFECDFGFIPTAHPSHCIRNKTLTRYDPYAVPTSCKSGDFYNRTKGYRKIDGDMCVDGFGYNYLPDLIPCPMNETKEFLIVAQRDKVARVNLSNNKLEIFPIKDIQNVIAIEFDMKNNCVYWADIMKDVIGRQCLSNGHQYPEIIVKTDLASIEGMALDWISNVLFFVDGTRAKIEAVRTDLNTEGRMRRTILGPNVLTKPRGIAVHPTAGYLFWTDWSPSNPSVSRSNLDGTDIKKLFTKPIVEWPNGVTVDHIAERIYWVDAMEDYIASSDLNGEYFKKILANDEKVAHPFAVAVFKDTMFWDDWKARTIFSADKDHGILINVIKDNLPGLMDIKVFSHSSHVGTNACASKENNCQALCLGMPKGKFSCLCPDGLTMKDGKCVCPGGKIPYSNMTCPRESNSCSGEQFSCSNGVCLPFNWRCDGDNDCGDNSDEIGCSNVTCLSHMMLCDGDKCIPHYYRCDHDKDCMDGTDEVGCHYENCTAGQFQCKNGKCISDKWRCDGEDDCRDASDEKDCKTNFQPTCKANEFRCPSGSCIPLTWTCDGEHDCPDAADEMKKLCKEATCADWMFKCPGNGKCLVPNWVCDGEDDCQDGFHSDELNCTNRNPPVPTVPPQINFPTQIACHDWMYLCGNHKCIPYWWKCDGVDDCGDNSDETGCGNIPNENQDDKKTTSNPNSNGIEPPTTCKKNYFMCRDGECVPSTWVCDGAPDCSSGEDELHCEGQNKGTGGNYNCKEFSCRQDGGCIPLKSVCDGQIDCADGSDEIGCQRNGTNIDPTEKKCKAHEFYCDKGRCLPLYMRCDNKEDCYDGLDEQNCTLLEKEAALSRVNLLAAPQSGINTTSITLYWKVHSTAGYVFQYLPSISEVGSNNGQWINSTEWIDTLSYQFTKLKPFTEYNMTVYARVVSSARKDGYSPSQYISATTGEAEPTPPRRVIVRQMTGSRVQVEWDPPAESYGDLVGYTVMVTPPIPPITVNVPPTVTSTYIEEGHFKPKSSYTFWVIARNSLYDSRISETATLVFDAIGDVDDLQNFTVIIIDENSVTLGWQTIRGIDGYIVKQQLPTLYPDIEPIKTTKNNITLTNLSPGVNYTFEVQAYKGDQIGKPVKKMLAIPGRQFPSLPDFKGSLVNNTSVLLSWNVPKDFKTTGNQLKYAVHYGFTRDELSKESKLITSNTSVLVDNLQACDRYLFSVGLVKPGLGPLTIEPVLITTKNDDRAPVKNIQVKRDETNDHVMVITWEPSCSSVDEMVKYVISVTELTLNKTTSVQLQPTANKTLSHTFNNMEYGGKYNVTIKRNFPGASQASALVTGPPLKPPHQLQLWRDSTGHYVLYWENHDLPVNDMHYYYEVLITDDDDEDIKKVMKVPGPPVSVPDLEVGRAYSISVRLVTDSGYKSAISEQWSIKIPQDVTSPNTSMYVGIPLGLFAIIACVALAVLAFKHKRLTTSFARFANPRYDNRSGTATLGNASDIMDEDDAPPIRGFADDEPLVIA